MNRDPKIQLCLLIAQRLFVGTANGRTRGALLASRSYAEKETAVVDVSSICAFDIPQSWVAKGSRLRIRCLDGCDYTVDLEGLCECLQLLEPLTQLIKATAGGSTESSLPQ